VRAADAAERMAEEPVDCASGAALEESGSVDEFSVASALFARSRTWVSVTPFLPTGLYRPCRWRYRLQ